MKRKLLSFESLPDWYKDNSLIVNGYRAPNPSVTYCLKSLFYLHNESGNIFSHLIGSILFTILFIYTINCNKYRKFDFNDKIIFSVFFFGIIFCLLTSTLFHCFQCHSRRIFKLMAKYWSNYWICFHSFIFRLDYFGITLSIMTSFIPIIYYGFKDSPTARNVYILLCFVIGIIGISVSLFERFSDPEFQSFRAILFIVFGLFGKT